MLAVKATPVFFKLFDPINSYFHFSSFESGFLLFGPKEDWMGKKTSVLVYVK